MAWPWHYCHSAYWLAAHLPSEGRDLSFCVAAAHSVSGAAPGTWQVLCGTAAEVGEPPSVSGAPGTRAGAAQGVSPHLKGKKPLKWWRSTGSGRRQTRGVGEGVLEEGTSTDKVH